MRGIYPWPNKACIGTQIVTDHRPSGRERTTMRSASIDRRTDLTDHPVIPAEAGGDDQVVLFETVSINRAIRNAHTLGANARALGQHTVEVAADNGECAEPDKLRLLPTKPLVLFSEACIISILRGIALGSILQYQEPLGKGSRGVVDADDLFDDAQRSDNILGAVRLDDKRFANGPCQGHLSNVARGIEDAHLALASQQSRNVRAQTAFCQTDIQYSKIRFVDTHPVRLPSRLCERCRTLRSRSLQGSLPAGRPPRHRLPQS